MLHKLRGHDPPLARCRPDYHAFRLHEDVEANDQVVGTIVLSLSGAAGQEAGGD